MSYACARSAAYSLASVSFLGVCGTVGGGLCGRIFGNWRAWSDGEVGCGCVSANSDQRC